MNQQLKLENQKLKLENQKLKLLLEEQKKLNEFHSNILNIIKKNIIISITDEKGIIQYVSDKFIKKSGYKRNELIGKPHSVIKSENANSNIYKDMWKTITSGKTWIGEMKNKNKLGEECWVEAIITPNIDNNNITSYISIKYDITKSKEHEHNAYIDELTGLYNKRYFNIVMSKLMAEKKKFSFIMIDIDYFKKYNDNYGHLQGDKMLSMMNSILTKYLRSDDKAFRLGGEEFGILIQNEVDLKNKCENILKSLKDEKIEHKYSLISEFITFSIGAVKVNTQQNEFNKNSIYHKADKLLYDVKKTGRNNYKIKEI